MKKIFAVVLALAMIVLCLASCEKEQGGKSYAANNTEYFIGATGPLTGGASSYGISVQKGATLAIEEINAAGGLNGVTFKFDMKDDKAEPADAASGYDMLYEAGMQISLGSVTSGACASFAEKSKNDNVFFITPSASAANVIENANAFRICFGDPDQGVLAAQEFVNKYENVGVIYDTSDPYSSGIFDAFKAEMEKLGAEFKVQTFDAENKKDFSTQVEALKDCDVIFLPIYYTEAGLIAKAAVAKGSSALIFGCDGLDGVADQIDETVTNTVEYITPFDVNSDAPATASFVKAFKEKYGETPDQFAADGYDAVKVIFEAMKAAGINDVTIDPSSLADKVIATITSSSFKYTGATGEMTWDASGACTKVPQIVTVEK
ncbi:MAG: ABC transporter substrate-binding protein [Clostridiales bacterium]|nr:ABC transporter substrate-binding protein [Clostridiales bacterium]